MVADVLSDGINQLEVWIFEQHQKSEERNEEEDPTTKYEDPVAMKYVVTTFPHGEEQTPTVTGLFDTEKEAYDWILDNRVEGVVDPVFDPT